MERVNNMTRDEFRDRFLADQAERKKERERLANTWNCEKSNKYDYKNRRWKGAHRK